MPMNDQQDHIVKSYDEELNRLQGEIVRMGGLAMDQLQRASRALQEGDTELAQQVIVSDQKVDALELEISSDVLRLLARRQPMATDLRFVLASLRIAAAIERIGDYATNIAKRSLALAEMRSPEPAHGLTEMAAYAANMLREALDAYVRRDTGAAMAVRESDLELDRRYNSLFRELLTYTMEDVRNIGTCAHFLFIAKNIERIGDHVTNIAENIWFQTEGELPAEKRPKGDNTNITPSS
jgi:phosphate transport system protein